MLSIDVRQPQNLFDSSKHKQYLSTSHFEPKPTQESMICEPANWQLYLREKGIQRIQTATIFPAFGRKKTPNRVEFKQFLHIRLEEEDAHHIRRNTSWHRDS